jgi:hypothetical protein
MLETEPEQAVALLVGEQELLRVIREDANAVDALLDHAVEHAAHAVEVEVAALRERRRGDREHARVGLGRASHEFLRDAGFCARTGAQVARYYRDELGFDTPPEGPG